MAVEFEDALLIEALIEGEPEFQNMADWRASFVARMGK